MLNGKANGVVVTSSRQQIKFTPPRYRLRRITESGVSLAGITVDESGGLRFAESVTSEVREQLEALQAADDDPGWPIYLLRPPRFYERAEHAAALARRGAHYPGDLELIASERDAIAEIQPDNALELLAVLDSAEAAIKSGTALDPAQQRARAQLELALSHMPLVGELLGTRARWLAIVPAVSFQLYCDGWSGADLPSFKKVGGMVPESLLADLPPADVEAAGWKAFALMHPGVDEAKNSAPPLSSSADRSNSPTTPGPTVAATNGTSSATYGG